MTRRLLWIYNRTSKIRRAVLQTMPSLGLRVTLEIQPIARGHYSLRGRFEYEAVGLPDALYALGAFPTVADAKGEAQKYKNGEKTLTARHTVEW